MARKPRIQFEGAIYHVINRGNYRRNLFESARAIQAFEACVFEAFDRFRWRLHGFCVMTNHYHLVLETPETNLAEGMQWLQGTYASRFNRFRKEKGHLFQGRYKAILVEPSPSLARVVNYVHLNPAAAGIAAPDRLASYRWSSLFHFVGQARPPFLVCEEWLQQLTLTDSSSGWAEYLNYLERLAQDKQGQKAQGFEAIPCGWAIGTQGWREALARDHAGLSVAQVADASEVAEFKQLQWSRALDIALQREGKTRAEISNDRKGAPWKIAIAAKLRETNGATNAWLARELHMGASSSVRQYLSDRRRGVLPRSGQ